MQGAAAEQEAKRLKEEVEREQLNVKAAHEALEAEKARMAVRAAAEKKRLLEKVEPASAISMGILWKTTLWRLMQVMKHGICLEGMHACNSCSV